MKLSWDSSLSSRVDEVAMTDVFGQAGDAQGANTLTQTYPLPPPPPNPLPSCPQSIPTTPEWKVCELTRRTPAPATTPAVRRLLQAYTQAHAAGGEEGQRILQEAVKEIQAMPELAHVDWGKVGKAAAASKAAGEGGAGAAKA